MVLVNKLRIYALLMRLQELEAERLERIREKKMQPFLPEPIYLHAMPKLPELIEMRDKKGKFFEPLKSKYHK